MIVFFFQAEDGIRDLVRSRGLGDVYKRQAVYWDKKRRPYNTIIIIENKTINSGLIFFLLLFSCLLYTSDAADERSSVDLGGRRIIKKKN